MNVITDKEIKHAFENPQWLKDNYPKAFESELEVGKWYKRKGCNTIVFYQGEVNTYGFYDDAENNKLIFETHNKWAFDNSYGGIWKLATPQEVETALINEAKKRGYKVGVLCEFGIIKDKRTIYREDFKFRIKSNVLLMGNDWIFYNGVWAEIIPQEETYIKIPLRYIQETKDNEELACLIRNIAENY